jgi:hypothetical protein
MSAPTSSRRIGAARPAPDFIVAFPVWGDGADPSDILDAAHIGAEDVARMVECGTSEGDVVVICVSPRTLAALGSWAHRVIYEGGDQ